MRLPLIPFAIIMKQVGRRRKDDETKGNGNVIIWEKGLEYLRISRR